MSGACTWPWTARFLLLASFIIALVLFTMNNALERELRTEITLYLRYQGERIAKIVEDELGVARQFIEEELDRAKKEIMRRLKSIEQEQLASNVDADSGNVQLKPLPDNPNYKKDLALYRSGASHSSVSKELGTTLNNVKRYYNWLVRNGYLKAPEGELSPREKDVVECLYKKRLSLRATARELGISLPNVVQRRDSALRKGYKPPTE